MSPFTMSSPYPSVFSMARVPQPSDGVYTDTLAEQRDTESKLAKCLEGSPARVPHAPETDGGSTVLRKNEHMLFLTNTFYYLPSGYVALDASRPWLMYWTVHSLDLLGVLLDQRLKDRAVQTLLKFETPTGGFGGGAGNTHIAHLLPTYAAVCSLAIVGSDKADGGWAQLIEARQGMYDFFMRMKRPDGAFHVCDGGEIDVRGTYCLLVVAAMLDLLTPELLHNVDRAIAACQTYEGGFAAGAFAFGEDTPNGDAPRAALAEAHGGYTACALNSHFILSSVVPKEGLPSLARLTGGAPFPRPVDVDSALRWNVMMQGEAGELGGFRGRVNKLVDGCYGWWVAGGVPVCEELARRQREDAHPESRIAVLDDDGDGEWADEPSMSALFNRVALQEYCLLAAQLPAGPEPAGGLRDKPGKRPDLYHTCNNLTGLSLAQHHMVHSPAAVQGHRDAFDASRSLPPVRATCPEGDWASDEERQRMRREVFANIMGWVEDEPDELVVGGAESRVNTTTPVFNILGLRLRPFVRYFYAQEAAEERVKRSNGV